jgi:hypothetical protein
MTAANKKPKLEVVRGIALAKVDEAALTAHLVSAGVTIPEKATAALKIELYMDVTDVILEKREEDYGECESCEAPCDPDGESCPVCGVRHKETTTVETAPAPIEKGESLDAAVKRIRGLIADSMKSYWQIGHELLAVHESRLYKTRLGPSEKPLYRTWVKFCEGELGISGNHARNFMLVAEKYSEAQVLAIGVEKLKFITRAPESERPKLLKRASKMSVRELESEVRAKNAKSTSHSSEQVKAQVEETARERRRQAETGHSISCVFQLGETRLPLRTVEKGFATSEELINDVVVSYRVVVTGRRHELVINRVRMTDGAKGASS